MTRIASGTTDQWIFFKGVKASDNVTRDTGPVDSDATAGNGTVAHLQVHYSRNGGTMTRFTTPTLATVDTGQINAAADTGWKDGNYKLLLDEGTTMDAGNLTEELLIHITDTGATMAPVTRVIELFRADTGGIADAISAKGVAVSTVTAVNPNVIDTGVYTGALLTSSNHDTGIADAVWEFATRTVSAATNITSDGAAINTTAGVVDNVTTVGSVTGAVGSVTGAVGSVTLMSPNSIDTGAYTGALLTSSNHDTGIADAVWEFAARTVTAATNITSDGAAINTTAGVVDNVTTVGSVTGAVGSVSGAVGSVTGAVGSVTLMSPNSIDTGAYTGSLLTGSVHDTGIAHEVWKVAISGYQTDTGSFGEVLGQGVNITEIRGDTGAADVVSKAYADTGANAIIANWVWDRVLNGANHNIAASAGRKLRTITENGSVYGGYIWIDTGQGTAGTVDYENGTSDNPVTTIADANTIAASTGISRFYILGGSNITLAAAQTGQVFSGNEYTLQLGGQDITGTFVEGAIVSGTGTGTNPHFSFCEIGTVTLPACRMTDCRFTATITASAAGNYYMANCYSGVAGGGTPTFDFGAAVANTNLNMRRYSGGIQIDNKNANGTDLMSLEGDGQLVVAASSGGAISLRGNFRVTNTGGATITYGGVNVSAFGNDTGMMHVDGGRLGTAITDTGIANATWKVDVSGFSADTGSFGEALGQGVNVTEIYGDTGLVGAAGVASSVDTGQVNRAVWENTAVDGLKPIEALRGMSSVLLGTVTGAGSGTEVFAELNDTGTPRVTATIDASGNRTSITRALDT